MDPRRPATSSTTCGPGPTCCAPSPASPRCPTASSPCRDSAGDGSAGATPRAHRAHRRRRPRRTSSILTPLTVPRDGVPDVVVDERALLASRRRRSPRGSGPVAVDAERASGYRYGQRAYLVQLRREGSGTWLIDPVAVPDLTPIERGPGRRASGSCTPRPRTSPASPRSGCVRGRSSTPSSAAACVGLPRVGLGAMVEHYLGLVARQGALGRRLVGAPPPRAVAAVCRPRRRGAR